MIRRIQIDNFKSLDGFSLLPAPQSLSRFTCLIGSNGSGKTSVLQVLDFLGYFMRGKLRDWSEDRGWEDVLLSSSFDSSPLGLFKASVTVELDSSVIVNWSVHYNEMSSHESVVDETVSANGQILLGAANGNVEFQDREGSSRRLDGLSFAGSSLSVLQDGTLPSSLGLLKDLFSRKITSFELVSPESLKRDSQTSTSIGRRGENLAGFTANLTREIQDRITEIMRQFYPNLQNVYRDQDLISKLFRQNAAEKFLREAVPASQFSDGFTRILALVAQIESSNTPDRLLLIDEIEDGIHPELMSRLVKYLVESKVQVIATTHSPLILNFLTDEQAKESSIFLYRNSEGRTRACRYFDLPSTSKKLGMLGPGEVYVDTSIEQLALEAEEMERGAATGAGATNQ